MPKKAKACARVSGWHTAFFATTFCALSVCASGAHAQTRPNNAAAPNTTTNTPSTTTPAEHPEGVLGQDEMEYDVYAKQRQSGFGRLNDLT
jgi:hypothetical protein